MPPLRTVVGDLAVRTVQKATGLKIDHYLETDFTGFVNTVDSFGGAKVCTDKPLQDLNSGLALPAGTHTLDGRRALRYVRARHVSPPGDLGRVRRQQRLLIEMLSRLRDEGAFANPAAAAWNGPQAAASPYAPTPTPASRTSSHLGSLLGGLKADQTEFATVPISDFDHRVPEWGSSLLWDKERSAALWAALREDRYDHRRLADPARAMTYRSSSRRPRSAFGSRTRRSLPRCEPMASWSRTTGGRPTSRVPRVRPSSPTTRTGTGTRPPSKPRSPAPNCAPSTGHGTSSTCGRIQANTVVKVVHDRSSVEGAPVQGDRLRCGTT